MNCGKRLLEGEFIELTDVKAIKKLPKERNYSPDTPCLLSAKLKLSKFLSQHGISLAALSE